MVGPEGIVLVEPHRSAYVIFLASQIADVMAYFEARKERARGQVNIDDEGTFQPPPTPPNLPWGTPSTSGKSTSQLNNNTPQSGRKDLENMPKSGVTLAFWSIWLIFI